MNKIASVTDTVIKPHDLLLYLILKQNKIGTKRF